MLHPTIVYGPVHSRRFGHSLGVNLLPVKRKICNFECVYCECGWTDTGTKDLLPSYDKIEEEIGKSLQTLSAEGRPVDHITFAGNGEPTLHPRFGDIIDLTIRLRNQTYPRAQITVLSNATRLRQPAVRTALLKIDNRVLKLDAGTESMFQKLDKPDKGLTLDALTDDLCSLHGDVTIQSMFHKGHHDNVSVDNTVPGEVDAWLSRLGRIRPKLVMIYTLARKTPAPGLMKVPEEELNAIAQRVRQIGLNAESFA